MILKNEKLSESLFLGTLLAMAGGFMDAYSYIVRGGVFANAETGNIVLLGLNAAAGKWIEASHYLMPIISFSLGIILAECMRKNLGEDTNLHWKEAVLWLEIITLFSAGFIPQEENALVNSLIAFICAMQVQAFRKLRGKVFATTMCTGNLRSGTEILCSADYKDDKEKRKEGWLYIWIDIAFVIGAVIGGNLGSLFMEKSIWFCALVLLFCAVYMHFRKKTYKM